jgi:hypothetical protein
VTLTRKILIALGALVFSGVLTLVVGAIFLTGTQATSFHAIVEPKGAVVLCIVNGEILFPDRCAGTGRLSIVQPIEEGEVTLRTAFGTVSLENEAPQNPACALSRAKWEPRTERTTPSRRRISKSSGANVLAQLQRLKYPGVEALMPGDVAAWTLDLDGDGHDEIFYDASNVLRVGELNQKTGNPYPYFVQGGVLGKQSFGTFINDHGTYIGGTDAIDQVSLKGIVPIAASTGEIALLVSPGRMSGDQMLIRFNSGIQQIHSFEFRCN